MRVSGRAVTEKRSSPANNNYTSGESKYFNFRLKSMKTRNNFN